MKSGPPCVNIYRMCSRVFKACSSGGALTSALDRPLVKGLWPFTSGAILASVRAAPRGASLTTPEHITFIEHMP